MKIGCIASGSSGNCTYIECKDTKILVDAGVSGKKINEGLAGYGVEIKDIDAILITHEHIDHIVGLGVISRKYKIPVYMTKGTLEALDESKVGKIDKDLFNIIKKGEGFIIKDVNIYPMPISHDAASPVAYCFEANDKKFAIVTDLGYYDKDILDRLHNLNGIIIEANHDVRLLQVGNYPYKTKQRILGEKGHLSNEVAGRLLKEISNDKLCTVILGHLSKENNNEDLAYETVRLEFLHNNMDFNDKECKLIVAGRSCPIDLLEI